MRTKSGPFGLIHLIVVSRPTVVLTMIVRNEAHVIERCINSVRPVIDTWCIVDTGSTDDTPAVIERALADLPGELHHRRWVDFAHNRTEALDLARPLGDFSLMIDADVVCALAPGSGIETLAGELTADHHGVEIDDGAIVYVRPQLSSTALPYRYVGVLHEFLQPPPGARGGPTVASIRFVSRFDGARSQNPGKFADDVKVLRRAIDTEPDEGLRCRYQYYLANSLRSARQPTEAIEAYRKRTTMGGWVEEVYMSWLWAGRLLRQTGAPLSEVLDAFACAHDTVTYRAEALCDAAAAAREAGRMPTAYLYARAATDKVRPASSLFLEPDVYEWRASYELSIAAWYVGAKAEGARVSAELLAGGHLPAAERAAVAENLRFYRGD